MAKLMSIEEAEAAGLGWMTDPADIDTDAICPYCHGPLAGRRNWQSNIDDTIYCSRACAFDAAERDGAR